MRGVDTFGGVGDYVTLFLWGFGAGATRAGVGKWFSDLGVATAASQE